MSLGLARTCGLLWVGPPGPTGLRPAALPPALVSCSAGYWIEPHWRLFCVYFTATQFCPLNINTAPHALTVTGGPGEPQETLPRREEPLAPSGTLFENHCCPVSGSSNVFAPMPLPTHTPFPTFSSARDSLRVFQKLSEIFSDENNYSLSRELLIKVEKGAWPGLGWGCCRSHWKFLGKLLLGSVWSMGRWRGGGTLGTGGPGGGGAGLLQSSGGVRGEIRVPWVRAGSPHPQALSCAPQG